MYAYPLKLFYCSFLAGEIVETVKITDNGKLKTANRAIFVA